MKGRANNLKARVFEFLSKYRKLADRGHVHLVSDDVNNARAAVCVHCPAQQNIAGGCGSCKRAVAGLRKTILGDRVPDVRLAACNILAEDTQITCLLDEGPVRNDNLPAHCWRKA